MPLEVLKQYLEANCLFIRYPGAYFAGSAPYETYKQQLLYALPPIVVFVAGSLVMHMNEWDFKGAVVPSLVMILFLVIMSYLGVVIWTLSLRYMLQFFGQKCTNQEVLHIVSHAALGFAVAWIPVIGMLALALLTGFWSFQGLVGRFKMNRGAALAAVTMPVVLCGFLGTILSFIFLWIASLSTIFAH